MEKNKTKAGVFKFTAKNVPPMTPNKINIPKDKLAAGEEFMAHAQLLADDSSLKIEVGKRSVTLKPKDWSEYVLSRAKRGKKVGKLINIERLIEEPKSLEEQ